MIFLTVGTQFPFDRLVKAVDEVAGQGLFKDEIFAQIGNSVYRPRNFKTVCLLDKQEYDEILQRAAGVISHSGMGTIAAALEHKKPMLVMPRLERFGEVVNDHQAQIARRFESEGYLLAAYSVEELPEKIQVLNSFVPKCRREQADAVAQRIRRFLDEVSLKVS
ncbi:MAG: hypothetical protein JW749_09165 [Sedimentisphaerales bacterium]|nr:hypothetical protein [Sedimentisphaerales bacterium]